MTQDNKVWILLLVASVSLVLTLSANNAYAFHELKETEKSDDHGEHDVKSTDANPNPSSNKTKMAYQTAHDVGLTVVYESSQGILHSKDFTYYSQLSGFNRARQTTSSGAGDETEGFTVASQTKPSFVLEGLVTQKHKMLYDMVDTVWEMRDTAYSMKYSQNDFYVALIEDGTPIRAFKYQNCKVTDYKVDTLYDGVFTYTPVGGSGRAFVDKFTFECDGYQPLSDVQIKQAKEHIKSTLEQQRNDKKINWHDSDRLKKSKLDSSTTWQDLDRYGNVIRNE
ncbi:MAG: hypothetical protein ACKOCQ_03345 [Candidatus Nitrosotenuis sp.]